MKIMIPYDGSANTEIALAALRRRADFAGTEHDALIVVSDVWLADSAEEFAKAAAARRSRVYRAGTSSYVPALRAWEEERILSREALDRMTSTFPLWNVKVETVAGFGLVSSEILEKSRYSNPDIIVMGANKSFADRATKYGAGALRVAEEANCNVFIARSGGSDKRRDLGGPFEFAPSRIALVLKGTSTDEWILQVVSRRKWAPDSEACLVLGDTDLTAISETQAVAVLEGSGLNVKVVRPQMDSPTALTQAVIDWNPDRIFACGEQNITNGERRLNTETTNFLQETNCSVELVRGPQAQAKVMRAAA